MAQKEFSATYLVTGGAGFIGSCFVRQVVADGIQVINLDRLTYAGNLDSLADVAPQNNHVFVHGDIGDSARDGSSVISANKVACASIFDSRRAA